MCRIHSIVQFGTNKDRNTQFFCEQYFRGPIKARLAIQLNKFLHDDDKRSAPVAYWKY